MGQGVSSWSSGGGCLGFYGGPIWKGQLSHMCAFGRWGIKVTQIGRSPSPGLGIGSGLIGGPPPAPGTYSGTYCVPTRARAQIFPSRLSIGQPRKLRGYLN